MPKLIAKEKFYYAGRNVAAGEEFDAEQQDVALLTDSVSPRARRPDPAPAAVQTRAMFSDASAPDPNMGKRKYNRRDMRAKE